MALWTPGWEAFPEALLEFWTERHLCVLTTVRADGRPHSVPVGVALDHEQRCAWVITSAGSHKARRVAEGRETGVAVSACQVDGPRWSTLEGSARALSDSESVRRAEECYARRYRTPRPNDQRVALRIEVSRFLVSSGLVGVPR